ncbi:MAG TPA: hypothetical protein VFU19_00690, partial [Iamia sp.]|nr:hypothetical protein [Iamia sp.]
MEAELLEGEAGEDDDGLGHQAPAGDGLVDPVADVGVLERAPLDGVEVDLAAEPALVEDAEAVAGAEGPLALAGGAAHAEGVAVGGGVGGAGLAAGLPDGEPVVAADPHLPPGGE